MAEVQEANPNLNRGNPGNKGRPKGIPQPTALLSDFRHVYTRPESEDNTEGKRNMRVYLRDRPMDFMRQMVQLELQNRARKKPAEVAAQAALVEVSVEGSKEAREEFEDEGQGRMEDWLKRVREDYDHERAGVVDVQVSSGGDSGG